MYKTFATLLIATTTLCSCASYPSQYVLPQNTSYANLKNTILDGTGRNDRMDIFLFDTHATPPDWKILFTASSSVSKPIGYIKVPTDGPQIISYSEFTPSHSCTVTIMADMQPGKNYSLKGGHFFEKGPIPFLVGPGKCTLDVIDEATKKSVMHL